MGVLMSEVTATVEVPDVLSYKQLIFWKEKLGYAVGDTASCLYWQTFSIFLFIFYTDTFGISAAVVGIMFLITRFWDAAIDPVIGVIADRTESKYGKFRVWMLRGIIPYTVLGIAMFITPNFSVGGKIVYAYITYTLVMIAYSMVNVPYGALLGVISPNSDERTKLASYRFIGAFSGNIISTGTFLYLVKSLGSGNDKLGYPLAMTVFAVAAAMLFLYTVSSTKERVKPPKEQSSVKNDIKDLLKNRPWVILCSMGLMTLIYVSVKNSAMLYYFKYYVGSELAAGPFLTVGTIFSVLGAFTTPYITKIFHGDKRLTFIVLTLATAICNALFFLAGPKDLLFMYVLQCLGSIPGAAMFPLIWSMYADTADYGEWKFGRRATGLVFSAATFSQKMGWAVGGAVAGLALTIIGYVANVAQTTGTLNGLRHMMSTIPAALAGVVILIAIFYNLDAKMETKIGLDLKARKGEA
jgi:GPH family glycoside/pentoside/hexuronide:cation symporter